MLSLNANLVLAETPSLEQFAFNPTWLQLLKYEPDGDSYKSSVTTDAFFLSESGPHNPQDELAELYKAVFRQVTASPDEHGQCRFPARYLWLKKQLLFDDEPRVDCKAFREWVGVESGQPSSISLLFISGYLGNPSSYYGHLLLKVNRGGVGRLYKQRILFPG